MRDEVLLESVRNLLRQELSMRQAKNARYSLRAFARDLEMSPAFLSQVLSLKRRLSLNSVNKIQEHLMPKPQQIID